MTDSTDNARGPERITEEELDELWEEFEISAKPTSFDGDMEFFDLEDMQDRAYCLYESAKSLLAPTPPDPRVMALVDAVRHEREMVCQDMGMQMAASAAVDAALAAFDTTGGKTDE